MLELLLQTLLFVHFKLLSQIFSAVLFNDYIYTLDSFRGGSGQVIAQLPQHLATIPQHFLSFLFSAFQLLIYFHKPVIFPDVVDFPSVFKFSAFNHFPAQLTAEQIQHSFPIVRKNIFLFLQISHYQQVHEPAYKQSTIPMCLQVAQEAYR